MFRKTFHWSLSKIRNLWSDSLYRNSFWLMAGSFSMAGIGFFYWIIAARLYTPEQIGLATTFLSATSLINGFAMLGFGTTLIRYLPTSEIKERKINTAFTVVSLAAFILGLVYLIGLPFWTEKLLFIRSSVPLFLIIALFFPINTINGITDSVFIAFRQSHWVFVSNISQSIIKLVALVAFSALGVWGVIGSNLLASVLATIICLVLIAWRYSIHFRPTLAKDVLLKVRKFAFGNYLSGIIGALPNMLLPIIITNQLSPAQTAYFYIPNMISSLLNVLPSSVARSFFTESSHTSLSVSFKRPLLFTYSILLSAIVVLIISGKRLLGLFGRGYANEGYQLLILVSISILISTLSYFLSYRLLLQHKIGLIVKTQVFISVLYITLVIAFSNQGIISVGFSSVITKCVEVLVLLIVSNFCFK